MGKLARIMICTFAALAIAMAASGSAVLADTGGPGVTAHLVAGR